MFLKFVAFIYYENNCNGQWILFKIGICQYLKSDDARIAKQWYYYIFHMIFYIKKFEQNFQLSFRVILKQINNKIYFCNVYILYKYWYYKTCKVIV